MRSPRKPGRQRRSGSFLSRENRPLALALLPSLLIHALVLSLSIGGDEPGFPGFELPWRDRRAEAPPLRVRLAAPAPVAPAASEAGPSFPAAAPEDPEAGAFTLLPPSQALPEEAAPAETPAPEPTEGPAATKNAPDLIALPPPELTRFTVPAAPPAPAPAVAAASSASSPEAADESRAEADRLAAAQQAAASKEAAQQEAARQEAARSEAARRLEIERQESERQAAARLALARQEAARVDAERQEAQRREAARIEAERQEAARADAARQAAAQLAQARLDAARQEAARIEAERQQAAAQQELARQEAARQEAARIDAARQAAARQEAARLQAAQDDEDRRLAARRAMGRQLDLEADQRAAAANASRASGSLPSSWSSARRGRLFGRADPNGELVLYAEAWARKIQLNTAVDAVREVAARPHTHPLVTVAIRSDGSVESVTFVVSSGVPEIDEAVRRIVQGQVPFPAFSPALAREYDVIEIRRTWHFDSAVRLY